MSTATPTHRVETIDTDRPGVPLSRIVNVELRKMFDTRSGFWLMASIGILSLLATIGVILFLPDENLAYGAFSAAVGVPMTILLPIMAILSVTGEWSQRTGLITFTLVPHRSQIILGKAIAAVHRRRRLDGARLLHRRGRQHHRVRDSTAWTSRGT